MFTVDFYEWIPYRKIAEFVFNEVVPIPKVGDLVHINDKCYYIMAEAACIYYSIDDFKIILTVRR